MSGASDAAFPHLPPIAVAMIGLDAGAAEVGGLPAGGERVRAMIAWMAMAGARGVRLDATAMGIRPRELDRSGRRDLASLLRRHELAFAGIDLPIPPQHFSKPDAADRAVAAALGAIGLAADMGQLAQGSVVSRGLAGRAASGGLATVSLTLPTVLAPDIRRAMLDDAHTRGVRIADHAWPIAPSAAAEEPALGVGLDPATALMAGADPVALAAQLGSRLACARLSDIAGGGAIGRALPGRGRLDVDAYLVTLATVGYSSHVVLDLAGLRDPGAAIAAVMERRAIGG